MTVPHAPLQIANSGLVGRRSRRDSGWWRDPRSRQDAAKLAKKLPDDAKKLISEYPPKKKK